MVINIYIHIYLMYQYYRFTEKTKTSAQKKMINKPNGMVTTHSTNDETKHDNSK